MRCKRGLGIILAAVSVFCVQLIGCSSVYYPSPDIAPHLIETADAAPYRPINGKAEQALSALDEGGLSAEQYRRRVDELYATVVFDRKKPLFAENDPVKPIYDNAVAVLDRYVLNAWHDGDGYETVHAVHDWLAYNIDYDFALYDAYQNGDSELSDNAAFHIDGVFLNGRAVCDGLSRAFNFLCAVEDIEAVRVTGSFASAPHAWNKVKLGDEWFNIDVTADAAYYTVGGKTNKQISHGYFLLSDKTMSDFLPQGHIFGGQPHVAEKDGDYYSDKTVNIGGKEFSATLRSQAELNALFSAVSGQKGRVGKIEVKLDFGGKTQINSADMYVSEISAAYAQLDDPGFDISAPNKPYFRYPNGVYLFLMYK